MHEHVGKSGDGALDAGGQADAENALEGLWVDAHFAPADAVGAFLPGQGNQDQQRRNDLGGDRRVSDPVHAHLEHQHEHQIQHRVQQRRNHQENERPPGVPHRPQDAAAHVVKEHARDPGKIDAQVQIGFVHHVFGRFHESQHRRDDQQTHAGGDQADQEGDGNGGVHGLAQPFPVVRAVALGNDDRRAGGKSGAEAHDGVDDRPGGAHGGLRLLAHELAHHHGIHRIVQLLKQEAYCHGNGELDQVFPDRSLGHIRIRSCHGVLRRIIREIGNYFFYK